MNDYQILKIQWVFSEKVDENLDKKPTQTTDKLGRPKYEHKYQAGKPNRETTLEEFQEALDHGHFTQPLKQKSFLAALYWIGARRTEPLEVLKEDIVLEGESLFIKMPAKKHGYRGGSLELPLSWPGVELIKERWEKTSSGRKVWPFSTSTAYRIIKRIWPERSPHWLRYHVVTKLRRLKDQQKIDTDDIKSWTGIKRDSTIEGYGLKTQGKIHKVSQVMNEG